MTVPRLSAAGRFDPARLFRPRTIALIGAEAAPIAARLALAGFSGAVQTVMTAGALTDAPDLAIIATAPSQVVATMEALAVKGCFAAIVPGKSENLAQAARRTGVRVLGANAFGLAVPALSLDVTQAHIPIPAGRLALIAQSPGLIRTIIDWAEPNGVGFSQVIGLGDNADVGFGIALDWLSQDPATGAILLEIGRIKDPRAFLSAARAASRVRPVVAFRSSPAPDATAARVFETALRRAGVLTVCGLDDMLAAAETLSRARPVRCDTLAILSADPAAGGLAAEAAARLGLTVTTDIRSAGGVLIVLTPGDIVNKPEGLAGPILYCVMGQTTGGPLRRDLAAAGHPVFASPEQAVHGFLHLIRDRRNRAAARELPDSTMLALVPNRDALQPVFATAAGALRPAQAQAVFASYGIQIQDHPRVTVFVDATFGPVIALGPDIDLPPLNLKLAQALAARSAVPHMAEPLVRISQLLVDFPAIESLDTGAGTIVVQPKGTTPARLAIAPYPAELAQPWTTGDLHLLVRPIRPEDAEAHAAFFKRLSPTDVRFRFFSAMHELSPERMARLTQIDYEREMAFIAVRDDNRDTVGVARLVGDTEGRAGEFAVIVQPDMKGRGLASHLMQRLIDWARDRGQEEIVGQILSDNAPMLGFTRHLGFSVNRMADDPEVMEARLSLR